MSMQDHIIIVPIADKQNALEALVATFGASWAGVFDSCGLTDGNAVTHVFAIVAEDTEALTNYLPNTASIIPVTGDVLPLFTARIAELGLSRVVPKLPWE